MAFNRTRFMRKKPTSGLLPAQEKEIRSKLKALDEYILSEQKAGRTVDDLLLNKKAEYENKLNPNGKLNAKKIYEDGIEFESNLEKDMYKALKDAGYKLGVDFDIQVHFTIMEGFMLHGKSIRPIDIYVDFIFKSRVLIETKGFPMPDWKLKWKLLKNIHRDNYVYLVPSNKTEIKSVIQLLKTIK